MLCTASPESAQFIENCNVTALAKPFISTYQFRPRVLFTCASRREKSGFSVSSDVAAFPGSASVSPVEWHGTRQNCLVNVSAKAALAWVRDRGQPMRLALLVTTSGDIHNPYVVQSIEVPFSVEVLIDGVQYQSIPHTLFAPAVLDPRGSDRWYTWRDEADNLGVADLADLSRISLQITI